MSQKLSQFAPSATNVSTIDQVVVVRSGSTDYLISFDQLWGGANMTVDTSTATSSLGLVSFLSSGSSNAPTGNIVWRQVTGGVDRFELFDGGGLNTILNNSLGEIGSASVGAPGGRVGWLFFDSAGTSRSQMQLAMGGGLGTGGISWGTTGGSGNPGDMMTFHTDAGLVLVSCGSFGIGDLSNDARNRKDTCFYRIDKGVFRAATQSTTAAGYLQWGGEARVTSDFSKTDASLSNVSGLSISIGSTSGSIRSYSFRSWLPVTCGSGAGGVQFAVNCTSTTITSVLYTGYTMDGNTIAGHSRATSTGTSVGAVTATSTIPVGYVEGLIRVGGSGTLNIQFAQNSSNATASVVSSGAYLLAYDIP